MKNFQAGTCCCKRIRYRLWWSKNNDKIEVGIIANEELCKKFVEVQRKSDRVMAIVSVFERKVVRVCVHVNPGGKINILL